MIVAFCGLPSSGKSTLVNSLIGKRILPSGVCRTTKEPILLNNHPIIDDDACKFIALDLPGICDSEEKDSTVFNEMTKSEIVEASIVFFVSDVHKAFMTTHEVNEYYKLKKYLEDLCEDTGKLYYIAIILSKCDIEDKPKVKNNKKEKLKTKYLEEISDSEEDTDLRDLIEGVRRKMPDEDIILFNSFGRIKKDSNAGPELKKLVTDRSGYISCYNTQFTIKKYYENYDQNQEKSYCDNFNKKISEYDVCNIKDIDTLVNKLVNVYTKISHNNKREFVLSLVSNPINFKYLLLIIELPNKYEYVYKEVHDKVDYYIFRHYVYMLNNNAMLYKSNNFIKNCSTEELLKVMMPEIFFSLSNHTQKIVVSEIIYGDGFQMSDYHCAKFLNFIFFQTGGFIKYEFKKTFNEFITITTNSKKYLITHRRLILFCCYKLNNNNIDALSVLDRSASLLTLDCCCKLNNINTPSILGCSAIEIKHIIKEYILNFRDYVLDPTYILINKLYILCSLFNTHSPVCVFGGACPYYLYRQKLKYGTSLEKRIYNSPEFKKIDKLFFENLVNKDVLIDYIDTDGLEFISTHEMMYNLLPSHPPQTSS